MNKLEEAIEQITKLRIDTGKNQHQYYEAVLKNVELKLKEVYKGDSENVDSQLNTEKKLREALEVCYKALCTYGSHPIIDKQIASAISYQHEIKGSRCCGRCDGVNDICVTDMECEDHKVTGCEACYGPR